MSALEKETALRARAGAEPRSDWTMAEVTALFELPFNDLLYAAQSVHRQSFDANAVQVSTLLSIKTGACPEDCAYCPQSIRYTTDVDRHDLMPLAEVRAAAQRAKESGATRFCMGASYRGPKDSQLEPILAMIAEVKALGLETCATLGLLRPGQDERLAEAGLDYYNHNLDSSAEFYEKIISTRTYADRLETLERVRAAGVKVCCGGIFGLGESLEQRVELAFTLRELEVDSVPLNFLNPIAGTPLEGKKDLTPLDCLRIIALFRYLLPERRISVCGGREPNLRDFQSWIFMAGASGTMVGNYLTTSGRDREADLQMFRDAEVEVHGC